MAEDAQVREVHAPVIVQVRVADVPVAVPIRVPKELAAGVRQIPRIPDQRTVIDEVADPITVRVRAAESRLSEQDMDPGPLAEGRDDWAACVRQRVQDAGSRSAA